MSDVEDFERQCRDAAAKMAGDPSLREATARWVNEAATHRYMYNFHWMGLPVIQFPQDLIALQELIWRVRPRFILETGVARGGSVAFHASLLQLLGGDGIVAGVDIDIRPHNRAGIESSPVASRIHLFEGSSVDPAVVAKVHTLAADRAPRLVVLDSNHSSEHVAAELRAYADLVTPGSYLVVLDTIVEYLPKALYEDRPWGPADNPLTAVRGFLEQHSEFAVDDEIENKLLITVAPGGYLKRRL